VSTPAHTDELIRMLYECLTTPEEGAPPRSGKTRSQAPFDHALNDDMIRLVRLEDALSRLRAMKFLGAQLLKVEKSLLEEMDQLCRRVELRAKALPPRHSH
jgi:hypothetical protein